jgi:cardiolipin synthase A/B
MVRSLLHDAAKRGVVIDILWGEDDEKTNSRATNAIVRKLRHDVDTAGFRSSLRIHSFSTRSHAKILVADGGSPAKLFAVVGSCNWLSSGFHSLEASIRLRDPRVVAKILDQLAALTLGADGHWTELTSDFARMSADAQGIQAPAGARGEIAIVLGPQHGHYVRTARDTAISRLFVTSHRMGAVNRPAVIIPAITAAQQRGVEATVYFGVPTGTYSKSDAALLVTAAASQGVSVQSIHEPRLHAKVLAWDNDHLLVTSQNWLSADPTDANFRREIGLYVHARDTGRSFVERFEALRRTT